MSIMEELEELSAMIRSAERLPLCDDGRRAGGSFADGFRAGINEGRGTAMPVDADGHAIRVGDVLHMPGDNDAELEVDGFVLLPTYRSRDFDRSCVITRPDLWRIVDSGEPEDDIKDAEWVELDGVRFVREKTCHLIPFVEEDGSVFVCNCSECDAVLLNRYEASYCPNCGARLEVE